MTFLHDALMTNYVYFTAGLNCKTRQIDALKTKAETRSDRFDLNAPAQLSQNDVG